MRKRFLSLLAALAFGQLRVFFRHNRVGTIDARLVGEVWRELLAAGDLVDVLERAVEIVKVEPRDAYDIVVTERRKDVRPEVVVVGFGRLRRPTRQPLNESKVIRSKVVKSESRAVFDFTTL